MGIALLNKDLFEPNLIQGVTPVGPVKIDWSNPMTKGLEHAFIQDASGTIFNLVNPNANMSAGGTFSVGITRNGKSLDSSADGYATTGLGNATGVDIGGPHTVVSKFTVPTNGTSNREQTVLGIETDTSTRFCGIEYRTHTSTAANRHPRYYTRNTGTTPIYAISGTTNYSPGTPLIVSGVRYSDTDRRIFVNGVEEGQNTTSHAGSHPSQEVSIGQARRSGGVGRAGAADAMDGTVSVSFVFSRALSEIENLILGSDIYHFIIPVEEIIRKSTAVSGQTVSPTGIASAEAFGTAAITTGAVTISPTGIASAEAFGTAVLSQGQTIALTGIASSESFGSPVLTVSAVTISLTGIASVETFGGPTITGQITIFPSAIASLEAFGTAAFTTGSVTISPDGIASGESFGSTIVTGGAVSGKERWFIRMKGRIIGTVSLNTPGLKHHKH